jgi:hypothetical protein
VNEILAHNNEKIARAIGRVNQKKYQTNVKKLSPSRQQLIKLPDLEKVLPKRSVFIIKGAEQGSFMSDTLRSRLEKNLRSNIEAFQKAGKLETRTGKINPELIKSFQSDIKNTFESYTKRDKKTGVPPQIRNIAVTEIRSTIAMVKDNYNREVLKKNPGAIIEKEWVHNRMLSKVPRKSHMAMNGKRVLINEKFQVKREGSNIIDIMDRPHDPNAVPEQVIGCSCDCKYRTVIIKEL